MSSARPTPLSAPLDGGLLIEASAGTGKTHTLTTLAARLVVEARRGIEDLLIVTFTVAATGELRTRVWQTLRAARDAVRGDASAGGGQAHELAEHWRDAGIDQAEARLTRAIRDFDRASITTIHGFCQRALAEFALHARLPFAFGVSGDAALEVESATRDFWRRRMVREPVSLLEYAKQQKFVLDEAAAWTGRHHAKPGVFRPEADSGDSKHRDHALREAWVQAFGATRDAWLDRAQRRTFNDVIERYRWKKGRLDETVLRAVIGALDANDAELLSLKDAGFFARTSLADKLYKANPPPDIPLFDCFERLGEAAAGLGESWLSGRRRGLLEDARETLLQATWDTRQLSFDALLTQLHRALDGSGGRALAARMRARYPVALIDEFQDTDRLQARIFEKIHAHGRAGGGLTVVGDPKQSIYRFRGADVFAYLDAKTKVPAGHALHLTANYRSHPNLVDAVTVTFGRDNPFLLPEIGFEAAHAAAHDIGALHVRDGNHDPKPFQLHLFPGVDGKKWTKGNLTGVAAEHAAGRIVRLLELGGGGRASVRDPSGPAAGRALTAGDIAVLVRTGQQGQAVAGALRLRGVRTVELGTESVFDSPEAEALHQLLHALAADESDYNASGRLRGALAGDLFGLSLGAIDRLREDDRAWAAWSGHAREWRRIWAGNGIAGLMRHLLFADHPACAANLLAYPDGPRRLTNFLHLTDLLHDAETRERLSRRGLMDWFAHFKAKPERGGETAQLRLESDENLVKIVTVHRAKGLEFPVVFCPFAWFGHQPTAETTAEYYDSDAATPVLDVCPSPAALDRQRDEQHSDELRLLYVALTRAQYRCEVTWARVTHGEYSPLAWLLHGEQTRKASERHVKNLSAAAWLAEARRFGERAADAISVTVHGDTGMPESPETGAVPVRAAPPRAESLTARKLERRLSRIRQMTSYSALTAGSVAVATAVAGAAGGGDEESPGDHDAPYVDAEPAPDDARDEFTFPAGSRPGNCLHEILANRLQRDRGLEEECRDALAKHGIGAEWIGAARTLVTNALYTPLPTVGAAGSSAGGTGAFRSGGATFRLADVGRPVAEMQFHLPVSGLRPAQLARAVEAHGYDVPLGDRAGEINGFLNGYIDVVARAGGRWYVIDYKSNWLGGDVAAYSPEAVERAMARHGYHLQYLLYLVALHRLLRVRLPDYDYDRHVGGAFYLFLRGMRPDAVGRGIYRDRPTRACIETIDACFQGEAR